MGIDYHFRSKRTAYHIYHYTQHYTSLYTTLYHRIRNFGSGDPEIRDPEIGDRRSEIRLEILSKSNTEIPRKYLRFLLFRSALVRIA